MAETKAQSVGRSRRIPQVIATGAVWLVSLALAIWGLAGVVGGLAGYGDPPPPGDLMDRMVVSGAKSLVAAFVGFGLGWWLYREKKTTHA